MEQKESPIGFAPKAEIALIAILGLSLPFTDFPFFVWRHFGVDLSHVAGGLLILVAAGGLVLWRRPWPPLSLTSCSVALLLVSLIPYAAHRFPGFDSGSFWRTYLHLGFMLAVFLAIGSSPVSWLGVRWILIVLVLEAVIVGSYGIWQTVAFSQGWPTGVEFLNRLAWHGPLRGQYGPLWRATATFGEPKWLSIYLLPSVCYAYALLLQSFREGQLRLLASWMLALFIIVAAIVLTISPGGIPAMVALLIVLLIHFVSGLRRRSRHIVLLASLFTAIAAVAVVAFSLGSLSRLLQNRAAAELGSFSGRVAPGSPYTSGFIYVRNFQYALALFRESPWFGVGVGQFAAIGRVQGRQLGFSPSVNTDGPWIGFGGILADWGLAGAILSVLLLASILRMNWKVTGGHGGSSRALPALLIFAVLLTEVYSGFYIHLWTWFPLGLAALSARVLTDSDAIRTGAPAPEDWPAVTRYGL